MAGLRILKRAMLLALVAAVFGFAQAAPTPSPAPEHVLRRIQALLTKGDVPAARAALSRALKDYPKEPVLYNFLGVIEAQEHNYRQAESSFRKAIELAPAYAGAYVNLGHLYQENLATDPQAVRKGIAVYQGLLRLKPDSVEGNYQLAVLLQVQGSFRKAIKHLDRLPAATRDGAQALSVRCAALAGLGDASGTETCTQRLRKCPDLSEPDVTLVLSPLVKLKRSDLAVPLLEELITRRLATSESLHYLAALYEMQGKLAEARRTYENSAAAGKISVPLLLELARVAYKQKDFEGALGYLAHARDLDPKNAGVHFFFGMVCVEMDLPIEAEKSLKKAVELNPENPYYNYAMGAVIVNSRKWKEAIPYFEKYCEKKPDDPRGRLALASAHFHSYDIDLARKELAELVDKPATASAAHYYLGMLANQENDFPTALRELNEAIRLNPNFAEAYTELGFAQMQLEHYDEARKALEHSVKLAPDGQRANMVLLALYQQTDDPRAEQQAKRFQELNKRRAEKAKMLLRTIEARPY